MKDDDDDGIAFAVCVIKCTVASTLFVQFSDNTDSVNTDVFGWSPEVRVNEVLPYATSY